MLTGPPRKMATALTIIPRPEVASKELMKMLLELTKRDLHDRNQSKISLVTSAWMINMKCFPARKKSSSVWYAPPNVTVRQPTSSCRPTSWLMISSLVRDSSTRGIVATRNRSRAQARANSPSSQARSKKSPKSSSLTTSPRSINGALTSIIKSSR